MFQKALLLHQQGRLDEAAGLYREMLARNPKHADALHLLGVIEFQNQAPSAAVGLIVQAIKLEPNNAVFFSNLGLALLDLGRFAEALAAYDRALAIQPAYADAFSHRGNALRGLKRFDEALASYARALAIKPDHADALNNRGAVLADLKRFEAALASYDRALAVRPGYAEALNNRGNALQCLKRFDEALATYDRALAVKPDCAETLNNRGNALGEMKRFEAALASYDRALAVKADHAEVLNNRGAVLSDLKRFDEALASFDRAVAVKPDYAEAFNNRGTVLNALGRFDDALASYDRALTLAPGYAEAHYNRGNALSELGCFDEAIASYDRALILRPDYEFLFGWRLICKMKICDWRGIASDFSRIAKGIEAGEKLAAPAMIPATPLSGALQRKCSEIFIREKYPPNPLLPASQDRSTHDRIRLGYFSADFHDHATAYLMAGLFERHDRARFELFAFSFGPKKKDAMRARLEKAFDRFIEVDALPDEAIALLARNLEIDIAVDLKGFTQGSRTGVFALRPAPVQVNYLGYPGTLGAPYIDYVIADRTLIPDDRKSQYAEKIVYLPDSYQANDSQRRIADTPITRAECGLPESGFVFCCFNNNYKIMPGLFDVWMRLLKKTEGSVLWLLEDNGFATRNLRAEAEARGVSSTRLVFAKRVELPEHLARQRLADLFLDTLPYNAHTTASDALWAGLPVLTCRGDMFPGRVAASLLNAVGLPELITQNIDAYESLALELSANPGRLKPLRQKLADNRVTCPLFDTPGFTRHIESAYISMWDRHRAGLAPDHIHMPPQRDPGGFV